MSKPKELIKAEIISQLQQQSMAVLVDSLTEAQARIAELEAKVAELTKEA
jgi:uncharacterized coiled-coil protein SlyX